MKRANIFFLSFVLIILFIPSCSEKKKKVLVNVENLQNECVHRLTDVIVYDIFSPPLASRIYAYCNLAYYEAIRFKDSSTGVSIAAQLHSFGALPNIEKNKEYDFTLAAVKSFFKVAKALTFSKDSLVTTEKKILKKFKYSTSEFIYNNSLGLGDSIADAILKRATADNYKITRGMPKYSVFKETGKWQQTPSEYADAVEPNWRLIKTMLLDSAAQFKPIAPPVYNLNKKSQYYKELMEVYTISKQITPLQDTIAHYWDDNPFVTQHTGHLTFATKKTTPAGHWMGIIAILCGQQKAGEIKTAAIYALSSCAIFDGFISCWDEKYRSKMVRPITVIRETMESEWSSLLQTPPFPEYTSGHSVITSAAASILTHQMGDSIFFTDTTELEYLGLQRSFNSIQQASDEAGISRLYGGIHFRSAIEQGKKQGQQIGILYNTIFK
jgi:hypothetical protein